MGVREVDSEAGDGVTCVLVLRTVGGWGWLASQMFISSPGKQTWDCFIPSVPSVAQLQSFQAISRIGIHKIFHPQDAQLHFP